MRALFTVFAKEVRDNARDRRTVLTALLLGPLFAPVVFALMMQLALERSARDAERPLVLGVAGREHAAGLVDWLVQSGVELRDAPAEGEAIREVLRERQVRVVLVVPAEYGLRLREGRPAAVQLWSDGADANVAPDRARAGALLRAYASQLASQRLQVRGVSPMVVMPVVVDEVDVSTPAGRALLLLGMLSYFLLVATLTGGLYVAIDATAGERERGSLESLLTLPVARAELILGKILAASAFMVLSLALTLAAFTVALRFVRLDAIGMTANLGPLQALQIFLAVVPFVPLGAALMTVVASFTRSYREAQTWLTVVLFVPTLPILVAAVLSLQPQPPFYAVPSLGQHLLMTGVLRGEGLPLGPWLLSAGSTLTLGVLLAWLAARLYRREGVLG